MNQENETEKVVENFLTKKKVAGLLGSDAVFKKHSVNGLNAKTMLFQDGQNANSLYVNDAENSTTYLSYSDNNFSIVDENTTTIKENFDCKNVLADTMIVANSIIENNFKGKTIGLTTDALLVMVHEEEPALDFRKISFLLDPTNDIHNYIMNDVSTKKVTDIISDIGLFKKDGINVGGNQDGYDFFNLVAYESEPADGSGKKASKSGKKVSSAEELTEKGKSVEESESSTKAELSALKGTLKSEYVADENNDDSIWFRNKSILKKEQLEDIDKYAKQLASKLKGRFGKDKSVSPSKRISIKNFIRKVPNIYIKKRDSAKGKKVELNLFIDVSGSMSGTPVANAISVAMIFEKIASTEKTLKGNVVLSAGEGSMTIPFGSGNDNLMSKIRAFSGSEGIERAISMNTKILQSADFNICISDAQITDDPINKKKYEARNIFIDAIYINNVGSSSDKQVKHMEEYFSRARILPDIEQTVEYITNVVLQK